MQTVLAFFRLMLPSLGQWVVRFFRALWRLFTYPVTLMFGVVTIVVLGASFVLYDYHRRVISSVAYVDSLNQEKEIELISLRADTAVFAYQIHELFSKLNKREQEEYLYVNELYGLSHSDLQRALDSAYQATAPPRTDPGRFINYALDESDPDDTRSAADATRYQLSPVADYLRTGSQGRLGQQDTRSPFVGRRGGLQADCGQERFYYRPAGKSGAGDGQAPTPARSDRPQQLADVNPSPTRRKSPAPQRTN